MRIMAGLATVAAPPIPGRRLTNNEFSSISPNGGRFLFKTSSSTRVCGGKLISSIVRDIRARSSPKLQGAAEEEEEAEETFQVLTSVRSKYNDILIVDTRDSRVLLLDSTHNVHSILHKEQMWTGSYWDEFASFPALIPEGPIAIFGLGGGTAAHLMLALWPSMQLEGWEIDRILIDKARDYFGLSDLEKQTQAGGILNVHIGDVFNPLSRVSGGYAGIVVDLFSEGKVLPQLQEVAIWLEMRDRLMPGGRLMVNCGGNEVSSNDTDRSSLSEETPSDYRWVPNSTIKALSKAFPGQLSWKRMPETSGENYLALTGPFPDLTSWSAAVPHPLSTTVQHWRPYEPLP